MADAAAPTAGGSSDAQARVDAAAARMEELMAWAMEVNVQFAEAQVPYKTGSTVAQSTRA